MFTNDHAENNKLISLLLVEDLASAADIMRDSLLTELIPA